MASKTQPPANVKNRSSSPNRPSSQTAANRSSSVVPFRRRERVERNAAIDLDPESYEDYRRFHDLWSQLRDPDILRLYEAGRDDGKSFRPDCWPLSCRQFLDYVLATVAQSGRAVSQAQAVGIAIDRGISSIILRLKYPENERSSTKADSPTDYLQESVYLKRLISLEAKNLSTPEADMLTVLKEFKIPFALPAAAGQKGGINVRVNGRVIDQACGLGKKVGSSGWDFAILAIMQEAIDLDDHEGGTVINPGHKAEMVRCLDGFIAGVKAKARALRALSIEFGLIPPPPKRAKK